jgi:hypothetical protein
VVDALHVATRKGLMTYRKSGGAWTLADTQFLGDPVSSVIVDPRDGAIYAALNLGHFGVKVRRSEDGGKSWTELPPPTFPEGATPVSKDKDDAPSVIQIWTLEFGNGTLWAGTLPGGLFKSTDRGATWSLVESLWNEPKRREWQGGGAESPGINSICFDPRDNRKMRIGVSTGGLWASDDGGASWRLAGHGLRAEYMPPAQAFDPAWQDVHRLAQCAAAPEVIWCQHHNGIFRSSDMGESFTEITAATTPSRFGFGVVVHPKDPNTAWFVPAVKDECRVPVDHRLVVARTRDGGRSFETLSDGLPPPPAFDLVYRHALDLDPNGDCLAMGSTTGNLWISENGGAKWTTVSGNLPPIAQVRWLPN